VEFGVFDILQVDPDTPTRESLATHLAQLLLADQLGLEYAFISERHFMPFYRASTPSLLLAHLAALTSQIRLGVMAYTLALHNPVLLAEEISALDHLSGGRLEVGVGLGHRPQEIDAIGLPAEHRHAIFLECLNVMRQLWGGEPVSTEGALYRLRDVLVDSPLQRPHPPLWYAGNDPNAAAWSARNGLSLAVGFQPDLALQVPARAFREARGDGTTRLAVMRHIYIADSDEQARDEIVADLMRLGADLAANPRGVSDPPARPPTQEEAEGQYADNDRKQIVVSGSADRVAAQISTTMRALDADVFLANVHLTGVEDARVRRTLQRFAEDVVPRVSESLSDRLGLSRGAAEPASPRPGSTGGGARQGWSATGDGAGERWRSHGADAPPRA
jgi:alkanesulfonate monooxygenase SsuD/methylene tetrahydromethanopterin reductase-like flavin-dependent oxidoreductase (luciferase family)